MHPIILIDTAYRCGKPSERPLTQHPNRVSDSGRNSRGIATHVSFPNPNDSPSQVPQVARHLAVTLSIAFDFRNPICRIPVRSEPASSSTSGGRARNLHRRTPRCGRSSEQDPADQARSTDAIGNERLRRGEPVAAGSREWYPDDDCQPRRDWLRRAEGESCRIEELTGSPSLQACGAFGSTAGVPRVFRLQQTGSSWTPCRE